MSELLQTGQHPDADQLNAFVEHTLPADQRQQTLAHLAICPDCRQVVALSLPPSDQAPIPQPQLVRYRWLPWAGISALAAALILIILFARNREVTPPRASAPAQMADARPPGPSPAASAPPTLHSFAPQQAPRAGQTRPAAPPRPTPVLPLKQQPASGVMGGILGGIGGGPPAQSGFAGSSANAGAPVTALAANRGQAVLSTSTPLPSHLAILSMARYGNRRLAIDTGNHLFFSDDEGRSWKAIPSAWKGRAVSVGLTSPVSFGGVAPALKMNFHPAGDRAAALSGTITDPSGAIIPGATVSATDSSGALAGSAITDGQGQYHLQGLAPGTYRTEVQASGFETQSFSTTVGPAQQAVADATLRVASAAQTVTIEASPANLTAKPALSHTPARFELTTDDGEHWTSSDGQNWAHE